MLTALRLVLELADPPALAVLLQQRPAAVDVLLQVAGSDAAGSWGAIASLRILLTAFGAEVGGHTSHQRCLKTREMVFSVPRTSSNCRCGSLIAKAAMRLLHPTHSAVQQYHSMGAAGCGHSHTCVCAIS